MIKYLNDWWVYDWFIECLNDWIIEMIACLNDWMIKLLINWMNN